MASEIFDLPETHRGCARDGPPSYLTIEEEEELTNFLVRCTKIDYAHYLSQVLSLVQRIVDLKGFEKMVTRGWWQKICECHRELCHCTAVPLSVARAMTTDQNLLDRYSSTDIQQLNPPKLHVLLPLHLQQ